MYCRHIDDLIGSGREAVGHGIGDDHSLYIEEDTRFLCIFEPALVGQEEAT